MPTFYLSWLPGQKFHGEGIFCSYPKSFIRGLLKKEKLAHISPVKPTAVCRKARKESTAKAKAAPTKNVKHATVALSLFVVNALENRKNSFIVGFAANKCWSRCVFWSYACNKALPKFLKFVSLRNQT